MVAPSPVFKSRDSSHNAADVNISIWPAVPVASALESAVMAFAVLTPATVDPHPAALPVNSPSSVPAPPTPLAAPVRTLSRALVPRWVLWTFPRAVRYASDLKILIS
ncbi:MAG: hypothetical protein PVI43_00145 [Candidatus Bathyarchaeota archaeon]